jgi:hypothetical protein
VFQVLLPTRGDTNLPASLFVLKAVTKKNKKESDGRNISYVRQLHLLVSSFDMSKKKERIAPTRQK